VKSICTFTIDLLFVTFECRIQISDVFFVFVTVKSSEFEEFGLVWLGFSFLLLFNLVHGQLAFSTFFNGKKLHITTIVCNISLTNILLKLKYTKILKLIRIILWFILVMIYSFDQCVCLTFQCHYVNLFFDFIFFFVN